MSEEELELLLRYPMIKRVKEEECVRYTGQIFISNGDLNLNVVEDQEKRFTLNSDIQALVDLQGVKNILQVLDRIYAVFNKKRSNPAVIYKKVLQQYCHLTTFNCDFTKCCISNDFSKIEVRIRDDAEREHEFVVALQGELFSVKNLCLPREVIQELPDKFDNLIEFFIKYLQIINDLQPFFNALDELDQNGYILDPEKPARNVCHRRIWLDNNLSVTVTLEPRNVSVIPGMTFLGPEEQTSRFQDTLSKNQEWEMYSSFLENFLKCLGLGELPKRPAQISDALLEEGACNICYLLNLNNSLPEVSCTNKFCENIFHIECLSEWLTSQNAKRVFNQLCGECPNCTKKISCPIN